MVVLNSHSVIKEAFVTQGDAFSSRPDFPWMDIIGITDGKTIWEIVSVYARYVTVSPIQNSAILQSRNLARNFEWGLTLWNSPIWFGQSGEADSPWWGGGGRIERNRSILERIIYVF